jgi:hypothetical protein
MSSTKYPKGAIPLHKALATGESLKQAESRVVGSKKSKGSNVK